MSPGVPPDPTGPLDDGDGCLNAGLVVALVVFVVLLILLISYSEWVSDCGPGGCL